LVEVHEEYDVEVIEKSDIDSGQKVLQILIDTFEYKFGESREDKACEWRQTSALLGRGEIEGKRIENQGFRVWSSLSAQWPSRRVTM